MEKIKIKPLTKDQLIISIDRLTRFKNTEVKYLRVFKEIILSNLILPKFKKQELDGIDYTVLRNFAERIINYSLESFGIKQDGDLEINQRLFDYEKNIFLLFSSALWFFNQEPNHSHSLPKDAHSPFTSMKEPHRLLSAPWTCSATTISNFSTQQCRYATAPKPTLSSNACPTVLGNNSPLRYRTMAGCLSRGATRAAPHTAYSNSPASSASLP